MVVSSIRVIGLDFVDFFLILGIHRRVGVAVLDVGPGDGGVEGSVVNGGVSDAAAEVVTVVHLVIHFIGFT